MPIHLLPNPSRREFLASLAFGGASLVVGRPSRADDRPAWFALVADTHVAADPATRARGQNMADNLRAVVADILAQPDAPRGVFIDGDLALKDGQAGDYATLLTLLQPLRQAGLPLHLALGNHDDRAHFRAALRVDPIDDESVVDKHVSVVDGPGLRFVVLDSLDQVDVTPGLLGERQLRWLARVLDAQPGSPAVVLVHHNLATNQGALRDTEALLAAIRPRPQVKAVVFGHTHVWSTRDDQGLHLVNLPAVGYPFAKDQPIGWCRLAVEEGGATLELRCVGGDRRKDGQRIPLLWRLL